MRNLFLLILLLSNPNSLSPARIVNPAHSIEHQEALARVQMRLEALAREQMQLEALAREAEAREAETQARLAVIKKAEAENNERYRKDVKESADACNRESLQLFKNYDIKASKKLSLSFLGLIAVSEALAYCLKKIHAYRQKLADTPVQDFWNYQSQCDKDISLNCPLMAIHGILIPSLYWTESQEINSYDAYLSNINSINSITESSDFSHKDLRKMLPLEPKNDFYKHRKMISLLSVTGLVSFMTFRIIAMMRELKNQKVILENKAQAACKYLVDQYKFIKKAIAESGSTPELEKQCADIKFEYIKISVSLSSWTNKDTLPSIQDAFADF